MDNDSYTTLYIDILYKFNSAINKLAYEKNSDYIFNKILKESNGTWVSFRKYINEEEYIEKFDGLEMYICWLNNTDSNNDKWRLITFFEYNELFSEICKLDIRNLKLKVIEKFYLP
ncbi:hypothetical protein [Psychrobacter vallis]|uniref:hypothetical protein n=1 Tax=Psychrobacter vallis TaxID=248451 RepID=UPI0019181DFE|nr:hypothetical protein [Psychrobacter vallis]